MKRITLHKKIDNMLVPYEYLVDDTSIKGKLILVSERMMEQTTTALSNAAVALDPRAADLTRKGYKFHYENGGLYIDFVPERYKKLARILSSPKAECFSDECKRIQNEYHQKRDELLDNPQCPKCEKGALYRKYEEELEKILPD